MPPQEVVWRSSGFRLTPEFYRLLLASRPRTPQSYYYPILPINRVNSNQTQTSTHIGIDRRKALTNGTVDTPTEK